MKRMKVLFVGIGSIARRHIRNLLAIAEKREISFTIDAFRRAQSGHDLSEIHLEYTDLSEVPEDYDIVFITNPTAMHLETLAKFQKKGRHFFIEKPIVMPSQIEETKMLDLHSDAVYYVAAPLRYHAVIQYIREHININEIISVRSISSSYLPDWRPGQDYSLSYSARKDLGGGVSIDLIHEWDYLTYLFGYPEKVYGMMGRKSALEIDSDDYAIYIAEFSNMIAELHLDYFGRKTMREIQLFMQNETIVGDLQNHKIRFLVQDKEIDLQEERDDFQKRELEHFLDMTEGKVPVEDGYNNAVKVLKLTLGDVG